MSSKNDTHVDIVSLSDGVTGNCLLFNVRWWDLAHWKFGFDRGLNQERKWESLNAIREFIAGTVGCWILSHIHVDHFGLLAKEKKDGFDGPIYTSIDTKEGLPIASEDCQHCIASNAMQMRIKLNEVDDAIATRLGNKVLYSEEDVKKMLDSVVGIPFFKEFRPHERISVKFYPNEHCVGAVITVIHIDGLPYNIVLTGDYNNHNIFFKARKLPKSVTTSPSIIITESTYGTTNSNERECVFDEKIAKMLEEKETIVIFANSYERHQSVLYRLRCLQRRKVIGDDVLIACDGKLSRKYTDLFPQLHIRKSMKDFLPENLVFIDNENRNDFFYAPGKKIIVASSGNASYGPAQFYVENLLGDASAYFGFANFVQEGSVGHRLKTCPIGGKIKINHRYIRRKAEIDYFTEFSSHAPADVMIDFLKQFTDVRYVGVTHGNPEARAAFVQRIQDEGITKKVSVIDRSHWFRLDQYGNVEVFRTKRK